MIQSEQLVYISRAALPPEEGYVVSQTLASTLGSSNDTHVSTNQYFPLFRNYFVDTTADSLSLARRLVAALVVKEVTKTATLSYYLAFNKQNIYQQGNLVARLTVDSDQPWSEANLVVMQLLISMNDEDWEIKVRQVKGKRNTDIMQKTELALHESEVALSLLQLFDTLCETLSIKLITHLAYSSAQRERRTQKN